MDIPQTSTAQPQTDTAKPQSNMAKKFSRKFYQRLVPSSMRERLYGNALVQGLRSTFADDGSTLPYVLLEERHMANLKVVVNRNALLSNLPQGAIAAEIGVNRGDFSRRIMTYAQPSQLHLIDIWSSERYHEGLMTVVTDKFSAELQAKTMLIHRGYSTDMLPTFDDGFFDWVYIDTDHSYATTAKELELCRHKVKKGGIIAGHDYIPGDWKLRYRYGVVEAVNEFCVKYNWEMILLTHETHRHLSYALREISAEPQE